MSPASRAASPLTTRASYRKAQPRTARTPCYTPQVRAMHDSLAKTGVLFFAGPTYDARSAANHAGSASFLALTSPTTLVVDAVMPVDA